MNATKLLESLKLEMSTQRNGCEHDFDRSSSKYCSKCGCTAYVHIRQKEAEFIAVQKWANSQGLSVEVSDSYDNLLCIGMDMKEKEGEGEELLAEMKKANAKIRELFGCDASLYSGVNRE
jgi:hypothetical protein